MRISFFNGNYNPKINTKLQVVEFKSILDHCKGLSQESEKGKNGCIFPYCEPIFKSSNSHFNSEGIVFIDIDNISNVSDVIYNNFEKLASILPNLIAVNFSYSHNLHFYVYDEEVKCDNATDIYKEKSILWLSALSRAILKVTGLDLRSVKKALDTHNTSINQRFFLNQSDYKYNDGYTNCVLDKKETKQLKIEYANLFKKYDTSKIKSSTYVPRLNINSNIDLSAYNEPKIKVDSDYIILNKSGFEARTYICAAVYYHFNQDVNKTITYLSTVYDFTDEFRNQLMNMISNNTISHMYKSEFERYLFTDENEILLDEDKYISDVFDLNATSDKFVYIQSNTNTGKTEFVKRFLQNNDNTWIIQMNKALRDGKKQGVEKYTIDSNYGLAESDKVKYFSTIDSFIRNSYKYDITNATIIVDESHLLQDYISMDNRYMAIKTMLDQLLKAKRVVFMTATPKQDINLFNFKIYKFIKKQPQRLIIHRCPLHYDDGKGSKERAKYEFINKFVFENSKSNNKFITYSDKKQECYKKYWTFDKKVTLFNSSNLKDGAVQEILQNNRLINDATICTRYMGVGIEIKNERHVNFVFCLDEGFTYNEIVQYIGRARDAEVIDVYFFYTNNETFSKKLYGEDLRYIQSCFDNLIVDDCLNLIAAKGINLFDYNYNTNSDSLKNQIEKLKVGNILNYKDTISASSLDVLTKLPYQKIELVDNMENTLHPDNKIIKRTEHKLIDYLLSLNDMQIKKMFTSIHQEGGYEDVVDELPYIDKVNAIKLLKQVNKIVKRDIPFKDAMNYFGSVSKAYKVVNMFDNYVKIKRNELKLVEFEGSDKTVEEIEKENRIVENVFNEEFINKHIVGYNKEVTVDIFDEIFAEVVDTKEVIFNGDKYQYVSKKATNNTKNNASKSIKLVNLNTKEIIYFSTKGECMKFLNVGNNVFNRFLKGQSKLNNEYKIG